MNEAVKYSYTRLITKKSYPHFYIQMEKSHDINHQDHNAIPSCCTPKKASFSTSKSILIVFSGVLLRYILSQFDLTSLLWSTEISSNLRVVLLLGLVASISTCLAITGWVIVWYTEVVSTVHPWKTQARLQWWRIIWFLVFGSVLWLVWEQISYSLWFTAWLNLIVSFLLLILAFQMLGFLPRVKWNNKIFDSVIARIKIYGSRSRCSLLVGSLTFFIPCGFTQMVQIMAFASGSRWNWWILMWVFALWTLPWLLLLWLWTSYAKNSHQKTLEWIIVVILIAFSLYSIQWSMSLLWVTDKITQLFSSESVVVQDAEYDWEIIKINVWHNWLHLVPEDLVLEKWKNYEITITPDNDGIWCMSTIALPSINKEIFPITVWQNIVYTINKAQPWEYTFVCSSMGMSQWKISIE